MKILDNKRKIMGSLREKNAMKNVSLKRKRVFFLRGGGAVLNSIFFLKKFQLHGGCRQRRTFLAVKQLNAAELLVGDTENAYRTHFR